MPYLPCLPAGYSKATALRIQDAVFLNVPAERITALVVQDTEDARLGIQNQDSKKTYGFTRSSASLNYYVSWGKWFRDKSFIVLELGYELADLSLLKIRLQVILEVNILYCFVYINKADVNKILLF